LSSEIIFRRTGSAGKEVFVYTKTHLATQKNKPPISLERRGAPIPLLIQQKNSKRKNGAIHAWILYAVFSF